MKKFKPALIILSIFILGLALGFLISGQLTKKKMSEFMRWGTEDGFKEIMIESINPDDSQLKVLDPILDKHAKLNGELHNRWFKEHGELMRDLTTDLETVLTPEQMEKWKGHNNEYKKHNSQ